MAHDWGHLGRQFLGDIVGQTLGYGGPAALPAPVAAAPSVLETLGFVDPPSTHSHQTAEGCDGMTWAGGTPPKGYKVVNYCGQGVLRKIRRRRRRRILSASDASDIATIVGLVGKGQMASALINRTRG